LELENYNALFLNLDEFSRPLNSVPNRLKELVKDINVCFYAIEKKANSSINELAFRRELNKIVEDNNGRVGNMLSVTPSIIKSAFKCDAQELKDLTSKVYDYMCEVPAVKVTSAKGTDVVFEFDKQYNWCLSTGFIEKKKARNIMPSEVYTHPVNVNGKVVIDGNYGLLGGLEEFFNPGDVVDRLKKSPIVWYIKDGRIESIYSEDKGIEKIVNEHVFEKNIINADRIGEYGMGTNIGIKECLGVMMHDEKYPGVHIAHGHGYEDRTNAKYECDIHYDGVLLNSMVTNIANKKIILHKGKYFL
jgi:aminopeptidase